MRGGHHVFAAAVDLGVDRERGGVHGPLALQHAAREIDLAEVARADQAPGDAERIHPEAVGVFGIASREVARHPVVVAEAREDPARAREARLAVRALLFDAREGRRLEIGVGVRVELAAVEHAFVGHTSICSSVRMIR